MAERLDFKGDYMGFTYNNVHSSELGIVRTSDGSRFNENLLPTMQDKTVQVPGGDGTYYFGSYYTQRQFSVSFAFDSLTETEVARIKRHFGDKKIHDLIFDETPYKVWSAKVTGTATIKYIPFDEGSTNRLYKGEGSIQFTCYYPFARCWSTNQTDYQNHRAYQHLNGENLESDTDWESRVNEWWSASGLDAQQKYVNTGDIPVPFSFYADSSGSCSIGGQVALSWLLPEDFSDWIGIDTRVGLAYRYKQDGNKLVRTNELLNKYCDGNLLVKLPVGESLSASFASQSTKQVVFDFTPEYF